LVAVEEDQMVVAAVLVEMFILPLSLFLLVKH